MLASHITKSGPTHRLLELCFVALVLAFLAGCAAEPKDFWDDADTETKIVEPDIDIDGPDGESFLDEVDTFTAPVDIGIDGGADVIRTPISIDLPNAFVPGFIVELPAATLLATLPGCFAAGRIASVDGAALMLAAPPLAYYPTSSASFTSP